MKDGVMPTMYESGFKARAVRLARDHRADSPSVTAVCFAVAGQLGMARAALRGWVTGLRSTTAAGRGVTTAEAEEIRRLRVEVKRLREAKEILKAASMFFAGALD